MLNGSENVDSKLRKHIAEHINAEVCLGSISDVSQAIDWLKGTFFYVRASNDPKRYGMATFEGKNCTFRDLDAQLRQDLILSTTNDLLSFGLVGLIQSPRGI